ncbi:MULTISPECIES: NADH:ubiquinone oxidoreductase [unclassified Sinorhizobium]|uniref:NADH:ubiquinone oxidoreductase n=1 Tax=unclassified Sinorhizobium TaxID=2613772 RepID=UPI0024C28F44|nr:MULTISPECIES: NADH:ubiquinone oxidoreductase [unclassified Sinorhizobium]MDK1376222.1 NADH:ubiquinone oxidoreductase [Sinorhizobium sp. 6-70]MDK1479938.1 NADH:ubiquinone oxidoreductase [Sinorhizobium sp. 6-117]
MAGTRKDGESMERAVVIPFARSLGVDPADPFGMAEWMTNMPHLPLHPLMAHPTAAVAAATALGFGLSSHIAGIMVGAMQGAVGAMQKGTPAPQQPEVAEPKRTAAPAKRAVPPVPEASPAPGVARSSKVAKPKAKAKAPAKTAKQDAGDDLKRISGIGPKLEQVLNARGIRRFADIAGWSEADVARLDKELGFDGRILRDDWVGQAKALKGA